MSARPAADNRPFRWNLVTPDQLGALLDGCTDPDLWYLEDLVTCAAKVLARSDDGRLLFVGRSADSIFDLLSGALADTTWRDRPQRLPFSFRGDADDLTPNEIRQARAIFAAAGLSPEQLARGPHPATFVDLVHAGHTFTNLYRLLRDWVDEQRQPWNAIRRRIRFVGITSRTKTSPNTWRWHQHADWTRDLPSTSPSTGPCGTTSATTRPSSPARSTRNCGHSPTATAPPRRTNPPGPGRSRRARRVRP
jgi:hypothetical protein